MGVGVVCVCVCVYIYTPKRNSLTVPTSQERVYPHFEYLHLIVLNTLSTLSCWLVQRQFQFVTDNDAGIMVF